MSRSFQFSTSFGLGSRPLSEMRRAYDPVLRNQYDHYLEGPAEAREALIEELWQAVSDDDRLLETAASEPQFVLHLARSLLERGFSGRGRPQAQGSSETVLETVSGLLEGFSIYRRKCAFLLLSGYPKDWAGTLLNVGTVQIFNTLEELQSRARDGLPVIGAAEKLALQEKAPKDPEALKQLESLIEGVLHWEDKQRLEEEAGQRLEVLETLVQLEEINHFLTRDRDRDRQSQPAR